jgi:putative hemolysin
MQKHFFVLCAGLLLLVGAGCSTKKTPPPSNNTPAPVSLDSAEQQQAYLFCTQKGYSIKIRFVESLNRNVAYCVLEQGKECESTVYMKGKCPDDNQNTEINTAMFEPVLADEFPLRLCEPKADPVCGVDGNTYTNGCVAQFLEIKIAHVGNCSPGNAPLNDATPNDTSVKDISRIEETKISLSQMDVRPPAVGTSSETNEQKPDNEWTEIPTSLLQSTGSNVTVRRCGGGSSLTFLAEETSRDHFTTLYTKQGQVLCYPDNDIQNECPSFVKQTNYKNSCPIVPKT